MKHFIPLALLCFCSPIFAEFDHFVHREGHRLFDGNTELRFAGIHAPELHRIEDDSRGKCAADPRGWGQYFTWPSAEEQENWIQSLVWSGHKVMRVYVLSVATPWDEACERETHILPPIHAKAMPQLNEKAMQYYDRMIALASQYELRLILPIIDHWQWWGGRAELAAFYGEGEDALYDINSQTYTAYLDIIHQLLTRKNSITHRLYSEEKAIMAWETGNELKFSNANFVSKTAAHFKSLAPRHLVVDGNYLSILPSSLDNEHVDIISNHYYTTNGNNSPKQIRLDLTAVEGKKVYMIGEFGLKGAAELNDIMQAAVHTEVNGAQTSGAFIWGMRGHRHNGGFYWHKEYTGHYSYRLPGFSNADGNEEKAVISLVRKAQAQMQGQPLPVPLPIPAAPKLRDISDPARINWMGAALASHYRVERQTKNPIWKFWQPWTPWKTIADTISDGKLEFDPTHDSVFSDHSLGAGEYRYRIFARNERGEGPASNTKSISIKHGPEVPPPY